MKTYSRKKQDEPQEVIIDLNELCRLCMAKEDPLVPIFNDDDPIPLTLRIMACVSLEVSYYNVITIKFVCYLFYLLFRYLKGMVYQIRYATLASINWKSRTRFVKNAKIPT